MTEHVTIRSVEPQERVLLSDIAFRSKAYWGYSTEFMEAARAELSVSVENFNREHVAYWLAESCDGVAGFAAVAQLSKDDCRLESLFIEPHCIGKGVGKLLVEYAKNYARNTGVRSLLVQSDPNAAPFYLAVGGVQVGEKESGSIPGRYLPEICISLAV